MPEFVMVVTVVAMIALADVCFDDDDDDSLVVAKTVEVTAAVLALEHDRPSIFK